MTLAVTAAPLPTAWREWSTARIVETNTTQRLFSQTRAHPYRAPFLRLNPPANRRPSVENIPLPPRRKTPNPRLPLRAELFFRKNGQMFRAVDTVFTKRGAKALVLLANLRKSTLTRAIAADLSKRPSHARWRAITQGMAN